MTPLGTMGTPNDTFGMQKEPEPGAQLGTAASTGSDFSVSDSRCQTTSHCSEGTLVLLWDPLVYLCSHLGSRWDHAFCERNSAVASRAAAEALGRGTRNRRPTTAKIGSGRPDGTRSPHSSPRDQVSPWQTWGSSGLENRGLAGCSVWRVVELCPWSHGRHAWACDRQLEAW